MSAHEEDGGRQCPECGVTFDIHETLGTCDKAVGPIVQAYEEAIAQVVELLGYDLENFQGQDARNLITELVDRVSRERTRQALERAAWGLHPMSTDRVGEGQAGPSAECCKRCAGYAKRYPVCYDVKCQCHEPSEWDRLRALTLSMTPSERAFMDVVSRVTLGGQIVFLGTESGKVLLAFRAALRASEAALAEKERELVAIRAYLDAAAAIRAPQPPEPETCEFAADGKSHGMGGWCVVHRKYCRSVAPSEEAPSSPPPPSAHRHTWGMTMCLSCSAPKPDPDAPPPSEWKEPTKGSMTVGDLPYVLCPTCQKRLPRAGWEHTCKAPPPSEEPRPCPTDSECDSCCRLEELRVKLHLPGGSADEIAGSIRPHP